MNSNDLLNQLQLEWEKERPDLDTYAMGIIGRLMILGEQLKKRAYQISFEFGLGYTDFDVLATVRRSGAPYTLRPADLLHSVLIQSGSLTACLDRLENALLIKRVSTLNDRRSRSVQLTDKGFKLIDTAIESRFADAFDFLHPLNKEERVQLEPLLNKLLKSHNP